MPRRHKSNREIGDDNLANLAAWLGTVESLPVRRGEVNLSALARESGVERQVLYRPEAYAMISAAAEGKGLKMPARGPVAEHEASDEATRRIRSLEAHNVILAAEVRDLRQRLKRYEAIERHLTDTGMVPR